MMQIKTITWLSSCLCIAAFAAGAADKPSPPPAASKTERFAWGSAKTAGDGVAASTPKKSRLKYRTADGTCACSCASGGISEQEIRKAGEARERARS
jgi:hypothetical protein